MTVNDENESITKSELINRLAEKRPSLSLKEVELSVNCLLETISSALEQGRRTEIRGFGSFDTRERAPRQARNPKTGERVLTPATRSVHFKPGKELAVRINAAGAHEPQVETVQEMDAVTD